MNTKKLANKTVQQVQFIGTTPEEVTQPVIDIIHNVLEKLDSFQPQKAEEYISLDEAAKRLKVDKSTLHNWRKRGVIKGYQLGYRVYLKWSEVEAAMVPLK